MFPINPSSSFALNTPRHETMVDVGNEITSLGPWNGCFIFGDDRYMVMYGDTYGDTSGDI